MRVRIDKELCQGFASCVVAAPEVFALNEDESQATVLMVEPTGADQVRARTAALHCPTGAVIVDDSDEPS